MVEFNSSEKVRSTSIVTHLLQGRRSTMATGQARADGQYHVGQESALAKDRHPNH